MQDSPKRRRILIVDDDLDHVHTLALLLRNMGHEVRYATNGYSAVHLAAQYSPELVLLDMGLPDLDGCEVARRLRLEADIERIVAMTELAGDQDRARSLAAGCEQHLVKPIGFDVLEKVIRAAAGS